MIAIKSGCFNARADRLLCVDPICVESLVEQKLPSTQQETSANGDTLNVNSDGVRVIAPIQPGLWDVYGIGITSRNSRNEQNGYDWDDTQSDEETGMRLKYFVILNNRHLQDSLGLSPQEADFPSVNILQNFRWEALSGTEAESGIWVNSGLAGIFCGNSIPTDKETNSWFPRWFDAACSIALDQEFGITGGLTGPIGCICGVSGPSSPEETTAGGDDCDASDNEGRPPAEAGQRQRLGVEVVKDGAEIWGCRLVMPVC